MRTLIAVYDWQILWPPRHGRRRIETVIGQGGMIWVRFCHKALSRLFAQSYRKLNEAELQQRSKLEKIKERKRKKLEQQGALKSRNLMEEDKEDLKSFFFE
jgi:exosome complex RNA-binding protein Rrp4